MKSTTVSFNEFEDRVKRIATEKGAAYYSLGVERNSRGDLEFYAAISNVDWNDKKRGRSPDEVCEKLHGKPNTPNDVLIENVPIQPDEIPR